MPDLRFRRRIESLTFVGEVYEPEFRAGGALLLARIDPDVTLAEGDAVAFSLDPAHCHAGLVLIGGGSRGDDSPSRRRPTRARRR